MARHLNDTNQGSNAATASFDDVVAQFHAFGSLVASLDVSQLPGHRLHELVGVVGGTESQLALCRSNVLAQIKMQGGDPVDTQKRNAKSSHSTSKKNANTSAALEKLPQVKQKMAKGGGMSANKASLLAGAAKKTSPGDVNDDQTLLDKVERQDEDRAKDTIDKWVRKRQSNTKRKSQRQKNIDERELVMFVNAGMVHLHGKMPADVPNMARFRRWQAEKSRLWRLDGGRESAHRSVRSDEQRGADAYANIQDGIDGHVGGMRDRPDWCADVENAPPPRPPSARVTSSREASAPPGTAVERASVPARSQVIIVAQAENLDSDDPDVLADIIGGGPLLRGELERHMCNSELFGVLFDPERGQPLWAGRAVRQCTPAQWRALLVRDGGCVLTGADPAQCEAHHVLPCEAPAKGPSDITNLAMVSVSVHHWLHDNQLTLFREPDGSWNTRPATPEEIAPRGRRSRSPNAKRMPPVAEDGHMLERATAQRE